MKPMKPIGMVAVALFEAAEKAGVKRFVFASTCSNYGKMADPDSFVSRNIGT